MAEQVNIPNENIQKLVQMLGFDPAKDVLTEGVFKDALKEVVEEREKLTKEQVKDELRKLVEVRKQMERIRRDFFTAWNKNHKELGKAVSRLQNRIRGIVEDPEGGGSEATPPEGQGGGNHAEP